MHQQIKSIRLIVPLVVCFGFAPMAQAVGPDTDGNIPAPTMAKGSGRSSAERLESGTPALDSRRLTT
jgi:hypothetical protein